MEKRNILEEVTNKIIDLLDKVNSGDIKYWIPLSGMAYNPFSKHTYSGLNQLLLSLIMYYSDYSHNNWMTFKQIQKVGGSVIKGEKSTIVTFTDAVFYNEYGERIEQKEALDLLKEKRKFDPIIKYLSDVGITTKRFLKAYRVFNVQQVRDLDSSYVNAKLKGLDAGERVDFADQIIEDNGAKIVHVSGNSAHYNPSLDKIQMPFPEQFEIIDEYYKTLFHELVHWSGHKIRLNRLKASSKKGSVYAFEELVAELGSAFICSNLNIRASITSSAAYIQSWLKALKNDKSYIINAMSSSERAMKYIIEKQETSV